MTRQELESRILELDLWLKSNQSEALRRFEDFSNSSSLHVFHAHIGKNNNIFVDSIRTQFQNPEDFIARWINGLNEKLIQIRKKSGKGFSDELVLKYLQDEILKPYIMKFLERNFYRNFRARIRAKPNEDLWSLWFGSGNLVWGLVIAPAMRNNEWTNDVSQMRRETYNYWTIGHVLSTGLIDPTSVKPIHFQSLDNFCIFYRSVLMRTSNSVYEKGIYEKYLDYLCNSRDPLNEPLLIPELRYLGKEKKHEHRLDFTILNSHTSELVGFELSPASTHINIVGVKDKTQGELNKELAQKWEKEMDKRMAYFQKFGIQVLTFTDRNLQDIDACFHEMIHLLSKRNPEVISVSSALNLLIETHT
jgi:hypothetical protein